MTASHDTVAAQQGPRLQEQIELQKFLESLTVFLDGKQISVLSNPLLSATLEKQFFDAMQPEPIAFLLELYRISQLHLTSDQLQAETVRLQKKYLNKDTDPYYLNIAGALKNECIKMIEEGNRLSSFLNIAKEANKIINENKIRPISPLSKEEVIQQQLDAYQQDKLLKNKLLPAKSLICLALESIGEAANKLGNQPSQEEKNPRTQRADTLVDASIKEARKMQLQLQNLLKESMKPDASLPDIQKKISLVLAEGNLKLLQNIQRLDDAFGDKNPQSAKIRSLLDPINNMQATHELMSSPTENIQKTRKCSPDEAKAFKDSSLAACYTKSNTEKVFAYEKQMKASETAKPEKPSIFSAFMGKR